MFLRTKTCWTPKHGSEKSTFCPHVASCKKHYYLLCVWLQRRTSFILAAFIRTHLPAGMVYVYLPLRCQCICASDVHVRVSALRSHGWKSCPTAFLPYSLFCLLMVSCRHPYCNSLCDLVWRERNALQEDDLKRHSCYRLQMCILKGEKVFAFIFLSAVLFTIKYFCHTMDLTVLWMADK